MERGKKSQRAESRQAGKCWRGVWAREAKAFNPGDVTEGRAYERGLTSG